MSAVSGPSSSPSGLPFGTQSHSFQTFGQYSQFLRSAVADEESLQMGESLQVLAAQIEILVGLLTPNSAQPRSAQTQAILAQALLQLLDELRQHRALLLGLGTDWHRFYEFESHFSTLNHFRVLLGQWALNAAPGGGARPALVDFELQAWRLLAAGALLLDVHEQVRQVKAPDQVGGGYSWWRNCRAHLLSGLGGRRAR